MKKLLTRLCPVLRASAIFALVTLGVAIFEERRLSAAAWQEKRLPGESDKEYEARQWTIRRVGECIQTSGVSHASATSLRLAVGDAQRERRVRSKRCPRDDTDELINCWSWIDRETVIDLRVRAAELGAGDCVVFGWQWDGSNLWVE